MIHLVYLPPSRPLCHFWYLMLVASFVMKLSPVCRKLILVIFSSPGSASFPMGSFHILNLGLQLYCFMLFLWDLSQPSTASQSPNLWPCLTMLLPPLSLLVSWAYIVSNSLPNSSAWMSYFTTVTLDVFWNWPHRLCSQSWLLFWTWRFCHWEMCWTTTLSLSFHSFSQLLLLIQPTAYILWQCLSCLSPFFSIADTLARPLIANMVC